jgi:hypothetical protein
VQAMSVVQNSKRTTKIGGVTGAGFVPGQRIAAYANCSIEAGAGQDTAFANIEGGDPLEQDESARDPGHHRRAEPGARLDGLGVLVHAIRDVTASPRPTTSR